MQDSATEPPRAKFPKRTDLLNWQSEPSSANAAAIDANEINEYMSLLREEIDPIDVLGYWKSKETQFKKLCVAVRSVLCIPASSCYSERLFSACGNTKTKMRNQIAPQKLDYVMRVRGNCNT